MPALSDTLRSQLEKTVVAARDAAERAAHAALESLAVNRGEFFPGMDEEQRALRRALRARAAQLGGQPIKSGGIQEGWARLVEEIAYEQWHRMLFARFLAENHLLIHPAGVAVTLEECAELAAEEDALDGWDLAARYAGRMLPGLFSQAGANGNPHEDPAAQVRFAPEGRRRLEVLLSALPPAVFTADDSLGWVYQFWQSKKKDEVNRSERKIGGPDLYPVTQLFTEDYMVQFLLQNSLGAWWAARHPQSPLIAGWDYLRWLDEVEEERSGETRDKTTSETPNPQSPISDPPRIPAAGAFPGWPERVADVTMMDPCGGSGHFVVAGFAMLRRMRMEEEGLGEAEAADAVIRDNLFMLEIDPRCTQIATFALALAAWKAGGYRSLPTPHIACSGIPVEGQLDDWLRLAGDDERLRTALERLYALFRQAPTLGSLINPADVPVQDRMFSADYHEVLPLLEEALARESERHDPAAAVLGDAARGVLRAARLLAGQYTLVATNVPYLLRRKQSSALQDFCADKYPDSKNDLATVFVERCSEYTQFDGATALVAPNNWLLLSGYSSLRRKFLLTNEWHLLTRLGAGAFRTIGGEVVNVCLINIARSVPDEFNNIYGLNVSAVDGTVKKANLLINQPLQVSSQKSQLQNPDLRIVLTDIAGKSLLNEFADSSWGISPADLAHYGRYFWEITPSAEWYYWQSSFATSSPYTGRQKMLWWNQDLLDAVDEGSAYIRGQQSWGKSGVVISAMGSLPSTLYTGEKYDANVSVVIPEKEAHLVAIWAYCSSSEHEKNVRKIDSAIKVTSSTLLKVPFDLDYWQSVAEEQYPDGLPDPWSNDPTQWLFAGHPVGSTEPLHVAVARLLGYRWPENAADDLGQFADADGIVCLPAVAGEQPAHERLRALLAHAYDNPPDLPDFETYRVGHYVPSTPVPPDAGWSARTERNLLAAADAEGRDLAYWLHYKFFIQHCKLFGNRPFLWHIWDGRNDGFAAIVNYHKLDASTLDRLIYTYLGAWIRDQRAAVAKGEAGADARLAAAETLKKNLEAIREGEPSYDIYVRWKELHEQPLGWQPDLNDGVRQNIRPFVEAGILRRKFSINWNKDRGRNPDGSERYNDLHFTRVEKQAARRERGMKK